MKILTVWEANLHKFDERVNNALADGYTLIRREVFPAPKNLDDSVLYAELALLDKSDIIPGKVDLAAVDPVALAEAIRAHCHSVKMEDCHNDLCPLAVYCDAIRGGKTPEEWPKPGEVSE